MPSTHTSLHYHLIFSTKNRERTINQHGEPISMNTSVEPSVDWMRNHRVSAAWMIMFIFWSG